MVSLLVLLLAALLLLLLAWDCWRWGITPMPSVGPAKRCCLQLMEEQQPTGVLIDLGCGLGGMARAMAEQLPAAHVEAVEGSRLIYAACRLLGLLQRAKVGWQRRDFQGMDLRGYAGVFCYLYPAAMRRLAPKLRQELPTGAWVVSNAFALPGWQPERVLRAADWLRTPVYLYRV